MPESWSKNAIKKASMIGTLSFHVQKAVDGPCSLPANLMSSICARISASLASGLI